MGHILCERMTIQNRLEQIIYIQSLIIYIDVSHKQIWADIANNVINFLMLTVVTKSNETIMNIISNQHPCLKVLSQLCKVYQIMSYRGVSWQLYILQIEIHPNFSITTHIVLPQLGYLL